MLAQDVLGRGVEAEEEGLHHAMSRHAVVPVRPCLCTCTLFTYTCTGMQPQTVRATTNGSDLAAWLGSMGPMEQYVPLDYLPGIVASVDPSIDRLIAGTPVSSTMLDGPASVCSSSTTRRL